MGIQTNLESLRLSLSLSSRFIRGRHRVDLVLLLLVSLLARSLSADLISHGLRPMSVYFAFYNDNYSALLFCYSFNEINLSLNYF